MTVETAVGEIGGRLDAIAELRAALVAEWLVWKFETLAQLAA